jgi:transcriptional regulator with XRE-family HTH domain
VRLTVRRDESILAAVGKTIAERRRDLGFSQEDLAEEAGLHRTYVGSVERGEKNVSLINLVKIAAALRIPLSRLLDGLDGLD